MQIDIDLLARLSTSGQASYEMAHNSSPPTTTLAVGVTTAPESLLVQYIQAHIKRGDKAKERAEQARGKAEQHFIAAGHYLVMLKANHSHSWDEWEFLLKNRVHLSTGRASELIQLADGRKDLQRIRDATAQRVQALRISRGSSSSLQSNVTKKNVSEPAAPTAHPQDPEDDFIEWAKREDARAIALADQILAENAHLARRLLKAVDDFPEFLHILHGRQQKETNNERKRPLAAPPTEYAEDDDLIAWAEEGDLIKVLARSTPAVRGAATEALIKGKSQTQFQVVADAVADIYQRLAKAGR